MLAVGAGMREPFEALGALEGLFSGVESDVFGQMMLVLELLVAPVAEPRPLV